MKKIYLNNYHNKALIIDEDAHTYTLTSATTASHIKTGAMDFKYWAYIEHMARLLKQLKDRGFKGFKRA